MAGTYMEEHSDEFEPFMDLSSPGTLAVERPSARVPYLTPSL